MMLLFYKIMKQGELPFVHKKPLTRKQRNNIPSWTIQNQAGVENIFIKVL